MNLAIDRGRRQVWGAASVGIIGAGSGFGGGAGCGGGAPGAAAAVVVAAAAGAGADMPWHRVPRALRVLVLAAAWFSYGVLLSNLNSIDGDKTAEIIWGASLFGFCIATLVTLIRPALFSSTDEFVTYRTAVRTGDLPDGVDLPVWERRLSRSRLAVTLVPWFAFPYLGFGGAVSRLEPGAVSRSAAVDVRAVLDLDRRNDVQADRTHQTTGIRSPTRPGTTSSRAGRTRDKTVPWVERQLALQCRSADGGAAASQPP